MADVALFDVFDTVITRRIGNPRAAFLLLGRRLLQAGEIHCSPHAYAAARTSAEIRAFRNSGGLDSAVSLGVIYHELANALHLSPSQEVRLQRREIELESELLVTLPDGAARVQEARELGHEIVYVSDMYLSAACLEEILRDRGLFEPGDRLFVSNEHCCSKATGGLWSLVQRELGVPSSDLHHTGNDERSDGTRARKAGIAATVLNENNLNRYEAALETHRDETDGLTSALAGASRLARLDPVDPTRKVISDVAAGVVAPFVIGHLLWTLEVARREGLSELFFVARDGQLLCDVARTLAPKVGFEGDCTYLYGSRQAWSLAGLIDSYPEALESLVPDGGDVEVSVRKALARFELTPEEIGDALVSAGFDRASWDHVLDANGAQRLRTILRSDLHASVSVSDNSKRSRDLVLSYLAQVGVVTDRPIGFVDLGTGATLFNSLSAILSTIGQAPPTGFYFGLRSDVVNVGFGRPLTYVRNEDEHLGYLSTPGLLTMVELACTADHGSVIGYQEVAGRIEPVLAPDGNVPVIEWGLPIVRDTVRRVAEELLLDADLVGVDAIDLRPSILDVFNLFWTKPTKAEALAWGAYPFEDGWGQESFRHPIAESRRLRDVVKKTPYRHWWEQGSARLSGPVSRTAFESRTALLEVRDKLRSRRR